MSGLRYLIDGIAAHMGNPAASAPHQMLHYQVGAVSVVQRYVFYIQLVKRVFHHHKGKALLGQRMDQGIVVPSAAIQDDPIGSSFQKKVNGVRLMGDASLSRSKRQIVIRAVGRLLYSLDHRKKVRLAKRIHHHADDLGLLGHQGAGHGVGLVIQRLYRLQYAFPVFSLTPLW